MSRWDPCPRHRGKDADAFVREYLGMASRRALFIGGGGFDPRSVVVCGLLEETMSDRLHGVLIREERPNPDPQLLGRADDNTAHMISLLPDRNTVLKADVFAPDGAVVGGRRLVESVGRLSVNDFSDVIVDMSALSIGVAFPIVRHLVELASRVGTGFNLHLTAVDEPETDEQIASVASDRASPIHGFKGSLGLVGNEEAAKLWMPQLSKGKRGVLENIHSYVSPHDVCPILPFPSARPRLPDELIEQYAEELESAWNVDSRSIVYTDEANPLDLYRTILRVDDIRRRVFAEVGASLVILTPLGSKVSAIGALLAAIERDFPIVYVEAISYKVDIAELDRRRGDQGDIVHLWLCGDAYASCSN